LLPPSIIIIHHFNNNYNHHHHRRHLLHSRAKQARIPPISDHIEMKTRGPHRSRWACDLDLAHADFMGCAVQWSFARILSKKKKKTLSRMKDGTGKN
jgi:hypothetical protein